MGIAVCVQQGRRLSRRQRHIKLVQAKRETLASGLYVGLLTGPTVKKSFLLHICRECTEHSDLSRREESLGDLLIYRLRADEFDIDAKLSAASYSIEG